MTPLRRPESPMPEDEARRLGKPGLRRVIEARAQWPALLPAGRAASHGARDTDWRPER
jgi:hypothetical protein